MKRSCLRLVRLNVILSLLTLPAVAAESSLVQTLPSGTIDWTQRWVEATGSGVPKQTGNPAQERLLAERAALSDAYRQLAETVHGVQITGETTVRDYVTENDVVRTRVQGVIKGARPTGPARQQPDGSIQITLRMPLYGAGQLSGAIELDQHLQRPQTSRSLRPSTRTGQVALRDLVQQTQQPALPFFPVRLASLPGFVPLQLTQGPRYTGLVIDMCTLPIQAVMSPRVLSETEQVYIGSFPIDPDQVIAEGVLQYYDDFDAALASPRVGAHPLIVEAQGTNERQTDILISPADAARIAEADATGQFLQALKVVVSAL
ncbi:MAG: LPP20 family lipoprotein [Candidatus Sericytochromatia bacterium]